VVSWSHLSLVGSAVTVGGDADLAVVEVLVGERDTGAHGHLRTDDGVAAVEVVLGIVEMHAATLALGDTGRTADELGEDGLDRAAAQQAEAVVAIRRHDAVLGMQGGIETGGDGLLAVVEMQEAADQALLVHGVGRELHATHREHGVVEAEQLLLGGLDLVAGSRLAAVVEVLLLLTHSRR